MVTSKKEGMNPEALEVASAKIWCFHTTKMDKFCLIVRWRWTMIQEYYSEGIIASGMAALFAAVIKWNKYRWVLKNMTPFWRSLEYVDNISAEWWATAPTPKKERGVLDMTLNCIWLFDFRLWKLGSLEYSFLVIILWSTLTTNCRTSYDRIYGSNRCLKSIHIY